MNAINTLFSLFDQVSGPWATAMLRAAIQGGMAVGIVWAICAIAPRISPRVRSWMWRIAAAKFVVALFIASPLDLPLLPAIPSQVTVISNQPPIAIDPVTPSDRLAETPVQGTAMAARDTFTAPTGEFSASSLLFVFWCLGVLAWCGALARGHVVVARWRRSASVIDRTDMEASLEELKAKLGLRALPELLVSECVPAPLVTGIFRPAVLLPRQVAASANPDALRLLLAHEMAHVRRHDLAWGWLQTTVDILFFFNPLAWLLHRELRLAQELACDAMALQTTQARPAHLGELLLSICVTVGGRTRVPNSAALAAAGSARHLRRRIKEMRRHPSQSSPRRLAAAAVIVSVLGTIGLLPWRLIARETESPNVAQNDIKQSVVYAGEVFNSSGQPVAGALVSRIGIDKKTWRQVTFATTKTGADGSFRFTAEQPEYDLDGVTETPCHIMVDAEGYGIRGNWFRRPDKAKVTLDLVTELRIAVQDSDGKPVAGLLVSPHQLVWPTAPGAVELPNFDKTLQIPDDARERLGRRTDANGLVSLPGLPQNTTAYLKVWDERFAQLNYKSHFHDGLPPIVIGNDPVTQAEPIRLSPASSIRGQVINAETGKSVAGIRVVAFAKHLTSSGSGEAISDANGAYQIASLPLGDYDIITVLDKTMNKDWAVAAVTDVVLAQGKHFTAPDLKLVRGALLTGRVLLSDTKQGVPHTTVSLGGSARPRFNTWQQVQATAADGGYSFRVPPGVQYIYVGALPPDGYNAPDHLARTIEAKEGETINTDLIYQRNPDESVPADPAAPPKKD